MRNWRTEQEAPALLLFRRLFGSLLLRLYGPWRDDAIHSRIRYNLAEVLMRIRNKNIDDVAGIRLRPELGQQLREIGVGHVVNRLLRELPRLIQLVDDLRPVGRGFFKSLSVESGRRRRSPKS